MISITINEHELDTILAALRLYQMNGDAANDPIATEHGAALDIKEIDALCEKINTGNDAPKEQTPQKHLTEIDGLMFRDAVAFFAARNTKRDKDIIALASKEFNRFGDLEFDDPECIVSEGEDNGAYVMAWKWVDFEGTPLDKERPDHQ